MKRLIIFLLFLFAFMGSTRAQKRDLIKIADSITNEGKALFRSEWASWYGTDIFLDKCKNKVGQQAGYISYDTGKGLNNIFFSKGADPVVLATTSFEYGFDPNNYKLDTAARKLTSAEKELFIIRQNAIKRMANDTIFKFYNNTSLNPVPMIINGIKRVYVLTGPNASGVVIFGNDYLVTFNDDNSVKAVNTLHKSLIPVNYGKASIGDNKIVLASIHTHLPDKSEFITATDICTLMLYEKRTTWNQYFVTSKDYASTWDCRKDTLVISTIEEWQKANPLRGALESSKN